MSETGLSPAALQALMGPTPTAAAPPGGAWDPLRNFASSVIRSGTSEMVGLPGEWVQNLGLPGPQENDEWRGRNFWTSMGSQVLGAIPGYVGSAMATGPLAALPAVARAAPWAARAFDAAHIAAQPVRALATQQVLQTVPISAARLALTPMLGGDLERVAASVGMDLAGSAVMGGVFGAFRGMRVGQIADDFERQLSQRVPEYNPSAPLQERINVLTEAAPNFAADPTMAQLTARTLDGLRQSVRMESSPSLTGKRNWLGPLEGETGGEAGAAQLRSDIGRLFRPTANAPEDSPFRVQTLTRSRAGYATTDDWRAAVAEVGLPDNWEANLQYPRMITAHGEHATRVQNNIRAHLGPEVGDGWHIRREQNQDLFLMARRLPAAEGAREQRWFLTRTNAPEKLVPLAGGMRRGDKLARFVGQAEENLLASGVKQLPETDVLSVAYNGSTLRPPGLRADKPTWDLLEHFPSPVQNIAKELRPVKDELWRKFKSVAAPTQSRFKDRPLASWLTQQAKSVYETATGKAARALHGQRPTDVSPVRQIMRGLPDQGGLRKMFDGLKDGDAAIVQRYAGLRERGKLTLDDGIAAAFDDVDNATRQRVEPLIREWDRVSGDAWQELVRTAKLTGTPVPKEVEGWALPHTWVGDWRQRIKTEDNSIVIMGGRTREEAVNNANAWIEANGGRLWKNTIQTDRDGDFKLTRELGMRMRPETTRVGITQMPNTKTRKAKPTGGYQGSPDGPPITTEELWGIMSTDIEMKYRDIAQRSVDRVLGQGYLPEIAAKYGAETGREVAQVLRTMRGEQGTFSKWQNQAMSVLDPLLGKNSASKIAAGWNAVEAHLAFGFGNMAFPAGNAVTFLQTVAPKLALFRQMGLREGSERAMQLFDFAPSFNSAGLPDGAFAQISVPKLGKAALQDMVNPSPRAMQMFNRATEEGVVAARIKDEYLGQKSRIGRNFQQAMAGENPVSNLIQGAGQLNMLIPHRVEELTRAHTFFTFMRVGELLNLTDDKLYEFAKRGTWQTMYGYAQADRPRLFTGPVGMMGGLFKNWMFNYIADLGQYSKEAMKGNYGGLLWALGSGTALAGAGGLPLYGLIDQFQRMLTDKPLVEELYGAVDNTRAADALYYGLPGLLGVSLQGMMAAPFNDPRRDLTFMTNAVALERAKKIGQVGGAVWDRWASGGENPLTYDRTWDQLAYAMGPRSLYRLFSQVEDGALMSIRNGRPIIEGVGALERGLNAIGFTSTNIARAWEASETLWSDQERRRSMTTAFAEAYSEAMSANNQRAMQEVIQRAVASGADLSSVMQGAMLRQRNLMLPQIPFDYLRTPGAAARMETLRVGQ